MLGVLLSDNLGSNQILSFVESFSANYYCRFCTFHKTMLQEMCEENEELLRFCQRRVDLIIQYCGAALGCSHLCMSV